VLRTFEGPVRVYPVTLAVDFLACDRHAQLCSFGKASASSGDQPETKERRRIVDGVSPDKLFMQVRSERHVRVTNTDVVGVLALVTIMPAAYVMALLLRRKRSMRLRLRGEPSPGERVRPVVRFSSGEAEIVRYFNQCEYAQSQQNCADVESVALHCEFRGLVCEAPVHSLLSRRASGAGAEPPHLLLVA
jgi:hypothetical protein